MSGLNRYLEFSVSHSTATLGYPKVQMIQTGLVVYENSVPSHQQDPKLCEFLEAEYIKICELAQEILRNFPIDFTAIPVYISEKQPTKTYYKGPEFLLIKMKSSQNPRWRITLRRGFCYTINIPS